MNLHAVVAGIVGAVNPPQVVQLNLSRGSTQGPDFSRTPRYATPGAITASVDANGVMTVTAQTAGVLMAGQTLADLTAALVPGTQIVSQLTGPTGGLGTYQLSESASVSSEAMTTALFVTADVQALTSDDIRQVDRLNLQGTHKAIYLSGAAAGLVRVTGQGGDLFILPDGSVWLVTLIPEQWDTWCHCVVTLQDGS